MVTFFKTIWWGIVLVVAVTIFYNVDFVFGDEHVFVNSICRGVPCGLMAIRQTGRFYPFTHCDNNFVLLIPGLSPDHYALAMYIANALIFLAIMVMLAKVMARLAKENGMSGICGALMVFLFSLVALPIPDFLRVFWENVFPESRLVLLLVLFVWCVMKARETDGVWYMIASFLALFSAIGYKETSFIPCVVFPLTMLIWGRKECSRRFRVMCYMLLALGIAYVTFYFGYWALGIEHSYVENRSVSTLDAIRCYLMLPMVALSFPLGAFRGVRILAFKDRDCLLCDALLFSALAMICAYVFLGIADRYYVMPAQFILLTVDAFWLFRLLRHRRWMGMVAVLLFICVGWQTIGMAFQLWQRSVVNRRQDMSFVRTLAEDKGISRIFYCRSGGFVEEYREYVFRSYFRHVGGNPKLCRCMTEFSGSLSEDDVLVYSIHDRGWQAMGNRLRQGGRKQLDSSWYVAVYGSVQGSDSKHAAEGAKLEYFDDDDCFISFYDYEDGGRWGRQNSGLIVRIPEPMRGKDLSVILDVGTVARSQKEPNKMDVSVGGVRLAHSVLEWNRPVCFGIPGSLTNRELLHMVLETTYAVCPKNEGINADDRELGVYFRRMSLTPSESAR